MCEIIEFEGKKLKAVEASSPYGCSGCFIRENLGRCRPCCPEEREDNKYVIFVEMTNA